MRGGGKVAEFAVAAGIGAAMLVGCGCAVASADDSATGGADTASSQHGPRAARVEARPRVRAAAERRREAAETRRVVLDTRRAARAQRVRDAAETTDDAPTAPDVVAPRLPLAATPRRERDTAIDLDITDGPQTVTTGPPSFMDRLILRTLQTLRHKDSAVFDGDGGNVTHTSPPKWVTRTLTITETVYGGMPVWSMASAKPSGEYVLALHGGGLVAEANIINWADYAAMARQTGATVVVPIYPLAPPKGTASVETLVPPMADYLTAMIDEHGTENVSLYGDSAGGTYAMLVAQELVRRCRADAACVLAENEPSRMVLISPVLHLTLSGPIVDDIDDAIIPPRLPPSAGGGLGADDPRVNPIMVEDLTGLPPTAIYVGTVERPYPGDLMFRDKLLAQDPDADFTVVIGDGQMHDWALGGIFVNSQARLWRPTIYRQLGLV